MRRGPNPWWVRLPDIRWPGKVGGGGFPATVLLKNWTNPLKTDDAGEIGNSILANPGAAREEIARTTPPDG